MGPNVIISLLICNNTPCWLCEDWMHMCVRFLGMCLTHHKLLKTINYCFISYELNITCHSHALVPLLVILCMNIIDTLDGLYLPNLSFTSPRAVFFPLFLKLVYMPFYRLLPTFPSCHSLYTTITQYILICLSISDLWKYIFMLFKSESGK